MSDTEYQAMMVKVQEREEKAKLAKALGKKDDDSYSQYQDSEEERNAADVESLGSISEEDSLSLGYGDSDCEYEDLFATTYGQGKALNNSFTGPYSNMDHIHVDKGRNAQFDQLS